MHLKTKDYTLCVFERPVIGFPSTGLCGRLIQKRKCYCCTWSKKYMIIDPSFWMFQKWNCHIGTNKWLITKVFTYFDNLCNLSTDRDKISAWASGSGNSTFGIDRRGTLAGLLQICLHLWLLFFLCLATEVVVFVLTSSISFKLAVVCTRCVFHLSWKLNKSNQYKNHMSTTSFSFKPQRYFRISKKDITFANYNWFRELI